MPESRERKKLRAESAPTTAPFDFQPERHSPSSVGFGKPLRPETLPSGIRVASTLDAEPPPAGRHSVRRTEPVVADAECPAANGRHPVGRVWRSPRLARRLPCPGKRRPPWSPSLPTHDLRLASKRPQATRRRPHRPRPGEPGKLFPPRPDGPEPAKRLSRDP